MAIDEAISVIKSECYIFNPLDFDKNTALDMAIEALEKQDRIAQILDDYDLLEAWEVLEMIKGAMKK